MSLHISWENPVFFNISNGICWIVTMINLAMVRGRVALNILCFKYPHKSQASMKAKLHHHYMKWRVLKTTIKQFALWDVVQSCWKHNKRKSTFYCLCWLKKIVQYCHIMYRCYLYCLLNKSMVTKLQMNSHCTNFLSMQRRLMQLTWVFFYPISEIELLIYPLR